MVIIIHILRILAIGLLVLSAIGVILRTFESFIKWETPFYEIDWEVVRAGYVIAVAITAAAYISILIHPG